MTSPILLNNLDFVLIVINTLVITIVAIFVVVMSCFKEVCIQVREIVP